MELHPLEVATFRLEQGFGLKSALNTRPFNIEISKLVKKCLQFPIGAPRLGYKSRQDMLLTKVKPWVIKTKLQALFHQF